MDSFDGNHKVDRQEFITGLRDCQVTLTDDQFMALYEALDKNNDGCVDFDEFLVAIRGKPNARRQAVIDKAFLKFDKDCSGSIDANDLRQRRLLTSEECIIANSTLKCKKER